MTPMEIDDNVIRLLEKVNPTHDPIYIDVRPEPDAPILECFPVVERKVSLSGGTMKLGWQVWKTDNIIEAEAHAVWETPDGKLVDITPKGFPTSQILFFQDENLKYQRRQINNVRLNITKNALVDDLITVSDEMFAFENRGERAFVKYLNPLLSHEQTLHQANMKTTQRIIRMMLQNGATKESLCGCGSRRKYKNCHGDRILKKLRAVK